MSAVLNGVLPLFALVLIGYLAMRFRLLPETALDGLNRFVYLFALPVMLFFTMAQSPLDQVLDWRLIAAYSGGSVLIFFAVILGGMALFPGRSLAERTILAGSSAFSNIAYLGVPLMVTAFGPEAGAPAGIILLADNLILISLIMICMEGAGEQRRSPPRIAGQVVMGFLRNPFMLGMILGAVWALLQLPIPEPVGKFGTLLGAAAAPCALFALGGTLYGRPIAEGRFEVAVATLLKLAALPLLVGLAAFHLFDLPDQQAAILTAIAALPTGANIFVLAAHYKAAPARASTIVLVTTGLAVLTVSGLLVWLKG